jgi:coiled-coil domain-containing protein 61
MDNNEKYTSVEIQLKSIDYYVNMFLIESDDKMAIELGEMYSADTWRGVFESSYIEDLTRKTGNYKSFQIFVNMLKTALKKESNTVSIDILTYADLEALRAKKSSSNNNNNYNQNNVSSVSSNLTSNKRFLILTYNVEFDRINYPLQLNYQGKTDIHLLLDTIKKLKAKIQRYENADLNYNSSQKLPKKLEQELERLRRENSLMQEEIQRLKAAASNSDDCMSDEHEEEEEEKDAFSRQQPKKKTTTTHQNEVKILKQIIKTIEEKSIKEKNMLQKQLQKKKQECDLLKNHLTDSKLNERNLKNELRTLNHELNLIKRQQQQHQRSNSSSSLNQRRSLSRDSSPSLRQYRPRPPIQPPSATHQSRKTTSNNSNNNINNSRSSSLNRRRNSNASNISPANSLNSITMDSDDAGGSRAGPLSNNQRRFNPTEYVKNKRLKQQEIELKK